MYLIKDIFRTHNMNIHGNSTCDHRTLAQRTWDLGSLLSAKSRRKCFSWRIIMVSMVTRGRPLPGNWLNLAFDPEMGWNRIWMDHVFPILTQHLACQSLWKETHNLIQEETVSTWLAITSDIFKQQRPVTLRTQEVRLWEQYGQPKL